MKHEREKNETNANIDLSMIVRMRVSTFVCLQFSRINEALITAIMNI